MTIAPTTTATPAPATAPTRGLIQIRDVHKSFGANEVLTGITLTVEPGEVVAILGPSGSGKSTLLRTINHLERVDRGTIAVDGELIGYRPRNGRLHELREHEVLAQRTQIGMVFQSFNLFPHLTALENVTEAPIHAQRRGKAAVKARAIELLKRVGLADKIDAYPRQLSGASSSGLPSPVPWPWTRRSCCSTSRRPRSIPSWSTRCWTSSATWPSPGRPW